MTNKQPSLWRCSVCEKVTQENKLLVDDRVQNSFYVQYGCPHCRNMNCMEYIDPRND